MRRLAIHFPASGAVAAIASCQSSPVNLYRLGDRIWQDTNGNGIQDEGEPGIANVELELTIVGQPQVVDRVTTDGEGRYAFENLPAGNYMVKVADSNFNSGGPLAGYTYSPRDSASDDVDSDFNESTGKAVAIVANGDNLTVDGGFVPPASPPPPPDDEDEGDIGGGSDGGDDGGENMCELTWLDWNGGSSSVNELRQNIQDLSRSGKWRIGDVIPKGPPFNNGTQVASQLRDWEGKSFIIPLSRANGNGRLVCGFARVTLIDYEAVGNRQSFVMRFLRWLARGEVEEGAPDFGLRDVRVER
ncbi:hypothetical protein RY27_17645 [Litorilinea aerophila]|nr:hypothetical protein RY27_17645 [Litorilinea aerophila]